MPPGDRPGGRRNTMIEAAVLKALERVDAYLSGESVSLPESRHRQACDDLLRTRTASARAAALFLMFYRLEDPAWDLDTVPTGARGKYGDKLLCEGLGTRHVTLHGPIVAYGENLGWKGNVRGGNVHLLRDDRLGAFLAAVADAADDGPRRIADYLACQFAESRSEPKPLPPVGPEVLTFVRSKALFHRLMNVPSEGYIRQFVIAALLAESRRRQAVEVRTHRPHAADRYDNVAGDIEEWHEGRLIRAYEVTGRDDWKNRLSGFRTKMDRHGLSKYVIIATGVNADSDWAVPARTALKLEPFGRDIAVVDIADVVNVLCAELTPGELRAAVNGAYDHLSDPKLAGKSEFKDG